MKLGFTGTRRGMTDVQKCMFEGIVTGLTEFHHGSCRGADVETARIIKHSFNPGVVEINSHPGPDGDPDRDLSGVDDKTWEPLTHFARNRQIVNATDELIACPCDMTEKPKGGTWYTVRYARKVGKKVTIIWPDGSLA